MELTKVRRGWKFEQKSWMERKVDKNTEQGTTQRQIVEKMTFGNRTNIFFGKTIEDV